MRAIIFTTSEARIAGDLKSRDQRCMHQFLDRPFLQHIVENFVENGFQHIDFILNEDPQKIEKLFGDGSRWGSQFQYHLSRTVTRPYDILKSIKFRSTEKMVMIAHDNKLISLSEHKLSIRTIKNTPVLFNLDPNSGGKKSQWSGYALISVKHIQNYPAHMTYAKFEKYLLNHSYRNGPCSAALKVNNLLDVSNDNALLCSQSLALNEKFSGLLLNGTRKSKGYYIDRNTSIHPQAIIKPPAYIGENTRINKATEIGPNVVVGKNCIIDTGTVVKNSSISPNNYIGKNLKLENALVRKNTIINVRLAGACTIHDKFIVNTLSVKYLKNSFIKLFYRIFAALLLGILSPVFLITCLSLLILRKGPVFYTRDVVQMPAKGSEIHWKTFKLFSFRDTSGHFRKKKNECIDWISHFLMEFIPGLINVLRGELGFIGVEPRTIAQQKDIMENWRELDIACSAGLIQPVWLDFGPSANEEDRFVSEACYAANNSLRQDIKYLLKYLWVICPGRVTLQNHRVVNSG